MKGGSDMGQYIDLCKVKFIGGKFFDDDDALISVRDVRRALLMTPVEDVVPREEVDKLEYTLLGVMHSVDKWLDGDELEQDEVNRAITMRENTLRIVENLQAEVERLNGELIVESTRRKNAVIAYHSAKQEVAREIFEEIESLFPSDKNFTTISRVTINRLKKKYTEVSK